MNNLKKGIAISSLLVLVAFGFGADPVNIAAKYAVGDSHSYKMSTVINMGDAQSGTATATGTINGKIIKIESNGNIDLQASQGQMTITIGGQEMDQPGGPPSIVVSGHLGNLVEIRGEDITPQQYRLSVMDAFIFPSKPVNVGDNWTYEYKNDPKTGIVKTLASFTYVGDETMDGVQCYKITSDIKEEEGDTPAESKGTYWISKADGLKVKATATWINVPVPGAPMPINGTVTVELVQKPGSSGATSSAAASGSGS